MAKERETNAQSNGKIGKKILLGAVLLACAGMVSLIVMEMNPSEEVPVAAEQPVEIEEGNISSAPVSEGNLTQHPQDVNGSSSMLKEGIDAFFVTFFDQNQPSASDQGNSKGAAGPAPLAPLPASGAPGAVVRLPALKNPGELRLPPAGGESVVIPGMPTQLNLPPPPPAFTQLVVSGIACNGGVCRASTSHGNLVVGNTIGGGGFAVEKIESIASNGIRTDKRFIAY